MKAERLFPIGYVSKATGLSPHVIRAWERRYGVVAPQRSDTNRRLYADSDIERLVEIREAVDAGHTISHVAGMDASDLYRLLETADNGHLPSSPSRQTPDGSPVATEHLQDALEAVTGLDDTGLDRVLSSAKAALSNLELLTDVVSPLMKRIGDLWAEGAIRIIHEHMASTVTQAFLWNLLKQLRPGQGAPGMVVSTPTGQWCQLGALMVAVVGADSGWDVHYFGPNLPSEEIAAAAVQTRSSAVALSLAFRTDGLWLVRELRKLSRSMPTGVRLYVGGRGIDDYQNYVEALGLECFGDLNSFADAVAKPGARANANP